MKLQTGNPAPVLQTQDVFGNFVDLSALHGRKVMLSFYRYASCPVCNLRMHELIQSYPQFKQQNLELIAVFQSSVAAITSTVGRQDAPFAIIPDPELELYKRFGVESRWRGLLSLRVIRAAFRAFAEGFLPGAINGPVHRVPADFLIDEDGRIAVAYYGKTIDDHLSLESIQAWLQAH